jgi:hypothetical protein
MGWSIQNWNQQIILTSRMEPITLFCAASNKLLCHLSACMQAAYNKRKWQRPREKGDFRLLLAVHGVQTDWNNQTYYFYDKTEGNRRQVRNIAPKMVTRKTTHCASLPNDGNGVGKKSLMERLWHCQTKTWQLKMASMYAGCDVMRAFKRKYCENFSSF